MLPDNVKDVLLRIGEIDWRGIDSADPEMLGKLFQSMVENTHETHGAPEDGLCHWVGTENLSVAMVGTSPSSGLIASIIAAGWNQMWAQARLEELEKAD